jgi:hypothetical protein
MRCRFVAGLAAVAVSLVAVAACSGNPQQQPRRPRLSARPPLAQISRASANGCAGKYPAAGTCEIACHPYGPGPAQPPGIALQGYLHILGRAVDVTCTDGVTISPALVEDTLCEVPGVRYAVVVTDPETAARVAAVVPWAGSAVDTGACRSAVAMEHGSEAAASLTLVPLARVPRAEQGKPDRPVIRALGREAASTARG